MTAQLEHANVTVTDAHETAAWLGRVFGWQIRWEGASIYGGYSIHVGSDASYLALYTPPETTGGPADNSYKVRGGLNHLAVTVSNIEETEAKVKAEGFDPHNHADYEPGKRFYFDDADGIEFEVVSYAA